MTLHKCGECAHPQRADVSIRRVIAGLRYCPEVEEYVREDDVQCLYFKPKNGVTLDPVMQSRAYEESYPNQGGLST